MFLWDNILMAGPILLDWFDQTLQGNSIASRFSLIDKHAQINKQVAIIYFNFYYGRCRCQ